MTQADIDRLISVSRHLGYLEGLAHITKRTGFGVYHSTSIEQTKAQLLSLRDEILSGSSDYIIAQESDLVRTYDVQK